LYDFYARRENIVKEFLRRRHEILDIEDELHAYRPRARANFVRAVVDGVPGNERRVRSSSFRVAFALAITAGVLAAFGGLAYSAPGNGNSGGTRPGWGCGDANHTHTGPPGNQYATNPCPPGSPGNP
jgi:hypothetical protein